MACEKGRATREHLHLGVCGEHGGDPQSIDFFESVGLDYVSCSPYRVPIARLAAAQASLKHGKKAGVHPEPKRPNVAASVATLGAAVSSVVAAVENAIEK